MITEIVNLTSGGTISAPVTAQKGAIHCDGRLSKTRYHLQFEPFDTSSIIGPTLLALVDIVKVDTCWGKGAGILPITPNGIEVSLKDGSQYQFIVGDPQQWIALLVGQQ
ncbi:hypothetical protein [Shewanella algidipiscicola]|uniref:Uncharacterized protein n=1 Tax=Shewanella algidipiscicola TaxID=614070 RepID=A0ABQ4PHL5_9GAMM|nr:hypothetical protein [Shewanella algidipiscicola]GIU47030.1 hypothetical protein TUM4630_19460 [Shewanella algidipiscicola]